MPQTLDFIATYVPALVELTGSSVEDTRNNVATYYASILPELDTSPNTVSGDLLVTPTAFMLAAFEEGMFRFMSDLDLANVASGTIYNCAFVEKYLDNFGARTWKPYQSSGVVRMVFAANKDYLLDRGTEFQLNKQIFNIYLPYMGPFSIYRVGTSIPAGTNGAVLHDTGSGVYFADVPLLGTGPVSGIEAGTPSTISVNIPELGAISALYTFDSGSEEPTFEELARRTQETIYAASMSSRNGAIRYVRTSCPFVESVYATVSGDPEMIRPFYAAPYFQTSGFMDLFVRSSSYAFVETQQVKLYLNSAAQEFQGSFPFTGTPYYLESVTQAGYPEALTLEHTITEIPKDGTDVPGAYGPYNSMSIAVKNVLDAAGNSKFTVLTDDAGAYSIFTVRYRTDPMLRSIADTIQNPDDMAVNLNVYVRGFTPVIIKTFNVRYVKKQGVVPLLTEAKTRIANYLETLGAPSMYSDAVVAGIMAEAGISYVSSIEVDATVQWAFADKIVNMQGTVVDVMAGPQITSSAGLRVYYPPQGTSLAPGDMYACSPRTVRYYLLEGAVQTTEIREM